MNTHTLVFLKRVLRKTLFFSPQMETCLSPKTTLQKLNHIASSWHVRCRALLRIMCFRTMSEMRKNGDGCAGTLKGATGYKVFFHK